ncbi:hypothetical protein [Deinococcus arenicola]|uniref:DUF5666 domain-containing protein n=1 Tax=Deinococcus arenicola TaxID=2994950 RepID=A0ABU4DN62_9DEIO|nr:hypothetical protein [Deinococcus sp. ZS9-10]MDV6373876.1 hypothetical protein [Deinococcus sp. ZS9-10]
MNIQVKVSRGKGSRVKWGFLGGLALALAACGGTVAPQASDQPTVTVLNGKVAGWKGNGRVAVAGLPSVSAPVREDGLVTLTLPGAPELAQYALPAAEVMQPLKCSGTVQSSNAEARIFTVVALDVQDSAGSRQVQAITGSKSGLLSRRVTAHIWVYSDRVTQLRGEVDCARILDIPQLTRLPVTVAANAQPGWNVAELDIKISANLLAQLSASGTLVNAVSSGLNVFHTLEELQAQVAF